LILRRAGWKQDSLKAGDQVTVVLPLQLRLRESPAGSNQCGRKPARHDRIEVASIHGANTAAVAKRPKTFVHGASEFLTRQHKRHTIVRLGERAKQALANSVWQIAQLVYFCRKPWENTL